MGEIRNLMLSLARAVRALPSLGAVGSAKFLIACVMGGDYRIRPRICRQSLHVRGKSKDCLIFYQVFCRNCYPLPRIPPRATIIDAGAHVGFVSVYFACLLPQSTIISIEVQAQNFERLVTNTKPYPNIKPVNAALWPRHERVTISNPDAESWSFTCRAVADSHSDQNALPVVTVDELIKTFGLVQIDLLKLDIEGAEAQLFSDVASWLSAVRFLFVEIHKGSWKPVFDRLHECEYDCRVVGENVLVELKPPHTAV